MTKEYKNITDLGLAAFLISYGFEIVSLDRANLKRVNFVFLESGRLSQKISTYWESPERMYFDNLKSLKNRLYSS